MIHSYEHRNVFLEPENLKKTRTTVPAGGQMLQPQNDNTAAGGGLECWDVPRKTPERWKDKPGMEKDKRGSH